VNLASSASGVSLGFSVPGFAELSFGLSVEAPALREYATPKSQGDYGKRGYENHFHSFTVTWLSVARSKNG
jgi:hypothetical protein